jgi:hypothetical protein
LLFFFFPVRHRVKKQAKARRGRLEDAKALFQLWEDHEEEEAWLVEKKRICQTGIVAKDLRALISLQQKHKVLVTTTACAGLSANAIHHIGGVKNSPVI